MAAEHPAIVRSYPTGELVRYVSFFIDCQELSEKYTVDVSGVATTFRPGLELKNGDDVTLCEFNPNEGIFLFSLLVLRAGTASATVTVGDSGNSSRFANAVSLTNVRGTTSNVRQHYPTKDALKLTFGGADPGDAKFRVSFLFLQHQEPTQIGRLGRIT